MFTATVETVFFAGHQITFADGTVEDLHEHEWCVRVAVESAELDEQGFVVDFVWLKDQLKAITDDLVSSRLEEHKYFKETNLNASAENVAKYIFDKFASLITSRVELVSVEVQESPGCWAKYAL